MIQDRPPFRHAQLFELLRQENLSDLTAERQRNRYNARMDPEEAATLQAIAARSWARDTVRIRL